MRRPRKISEKDEARTLSDSKMLGAAYFEFFSMSLEGSLIPLMWAVKVPMKRASGLAGSQV